MAFIEEQLQMTEDEEVAPFVKLSTVGNFYSHCLEHLNAEFYPLERKHIELKLKLASNLKKEVYISYKDDLAAALRFSRENSFESDAGLSYRYIGEMCVVFSKHLTFRKNTQKSIKKENILLLFF